MTTNNAAPSAPGWAWAARRAALLLALMLSVTTVAAYLAHASIEPTLESGPEPASIGIGMSAVGLLKDK
jgi:hypothetical protein